MSAENAANLPAVPVIAVRGVSKFYEIYKKPSHRLLQMVCRGRRQFYEPFWALRDISFTVGKGECVGIIGRNGAGKSTLLQIMAGTLAPSSGAISIQGRVAALLELGSGFNPEFTGRENVRLNAAILGLTKKEIDERFDSIAAFAEIGDFMDQPVKSYSSGMALRLAFSVIAHVDADVLIIDEALAVGDAFFTQKCMRFLRNFMLDKTVVFVSHDITAVMSLCGRAILMDAGRVALDGNPAAVARIYMKELYAQSQGRVDGELGENMPEGEKEEKAAPIPLPEIAEYGNIPETMPDCRDMRQDIYNASDKRNDLRIFVFNKDSEKFGDGLASIDNAWLSDDDGHPLEWLVGGEICRLHIVCSSRGLTPRPIVGFLVHNNKGQEIFGDNTYIAMRDKNLDFGPGSKLRVAFRFRMPILPPGDYFISIAIASGTQMDHEQHQWLHEAIHFTSQASSVCTGMVGIPMLAIEAEVTGSL